MADPRLSAQPTARPPSDADAGTSPVTVVTVTRNARAALEQTIESVLAQTHRPLEYLVQDGGSTDGTVELLGGYGSRILWVSEPDQGVYDAMNRALHRVTRADSYVFFLNADDRFVSPDAVSRVLAEARGADFVHCRLELRDDEIRDREIVGGPFAPEDLIWRNPCGHQMIFCRRSVFDAVGAFDTRYPIAADYDWLIRAIRHPGLLRRFVPEVVASMGAGGLSDRRYRALLAERRRIVRERFGRSAGLRYDVYVGGVEYPRLATRRALRSLGLLKAARVLERALRGAARESLDARR